MSAQLTALRHVVANEVHRPDGDGPSNERRQKRHADVEPAPRILGVLRQCRA